MKLWAKIVKDDKIISNKLFVYDKPMTQSYYEEILMDICHQMDISTPVSLYCHYRDISKLNCVKYLPRDFIDHEDIDYFLIEYCVERKKD